MIDEGFVKDEAGLGLGPAATSRPGSQDRERCSRWGRRWPSGHQPVCLQWSAARALAAGATEDEIADVLLAIAPVAGLGRVVCRRSRCGDRARV